MLPTGMMFRTTFQRKASAAVLRNRYQSYRRGFSATTIHPTPSTRSSSSRCVETNNYHRQKHCFWKNLRPTIRHNHGVKLFGSSPLQQSQSQSSPYGLYRLLSPDERRLLEEQKQLIVSSRELASRIEASIAPTSEPSSSTFSLLKHNHTSQHFLQGLDDLETTFSVVVAGEFNAGKSTLINALLGTNLLETGALPTTDSITVLSGAPHQAEAPLGFVVHSVQDLPLLEDLTLIDTPGTNSAKSAHTTRTLKLLPVSDLILFVTSADRPVSDSERTLLQSIQSYRKTIVVLINKMDILETDDQKSAVVDYVKENTSELLGARPVVIPLSGKEALSAKLNESSETWERSNFGALESFLMDTLTSHTKVRSKLSNPLRIVEGTMAECLGVLDHQTTELQSDLRTLSFIESLFRGWKTELSADLNESQRTMTELVEQEGHRCAILLHRMNHPLDLYSWTLLDRDRFEEEWSVTQREVSTNQHRHYDQHLRANLLEHIHETANLVATRGRSQGQVVIEYISKRPSVKDSQSSLVGSVSALSRLEETQTNLVDKLTKAVDTVLSVPGNTVDEMDKNRLLESLQRTALISSFCCASTIAAGIATALGSFDSGWIGPMSLFACGTIAHSLGKYQAEKNFRYRWTQRANHLHKALDAIVHQEVEAIQRKIQDGVAPYTRYVATERDRIEALGEECERVAAASRNLRNRIEKLR